MRTRVLTVFILSFALQGCIFNTDQQQPDYATLVSLAPLAGCYRNLGKDKKEDETQHTLSRNPHYLSQSLWPAEHVDHSIIDYIEVAVISETTLRTSAISTRGILLTSEFIEGRDFTLADGKLTISKQLTGSFAAPADNPFIGVAHTSITLGIDQAGDGRLTESGTIAGTAFLIIPVAGRYSESVRFERIGSSCTTAH